MRISVIILTLSKKVKRLKVDSALDFSYDDCLYELEPNKVCNKMVKTKKGWVLKDQVAVYFEGNPNPIGYGDTSTDLRERVIIDNAIWQCASVPKRTSRKKIAIILILVSLAVMGSAYWLFQLGGLAMVKGWFGIK